MTVAMASRNCSGREHQPPDPGAPVAHPRLPGPSAFTVAFLAFGIRKCHGRQPPVFMTLSIRYVTEFNGNGGCRDTVPSKRPAHEVTRGIPRGSA